MNSQKKEMVPYAKVVPELNKYGFVVIPLNGKKPFLKGWNKIKKTPERLYIFEGHNLGIICGEASGITVLDIDVKDEGMKIWNSLSSAYPLIHTPTTRTPSGGLHIYFRYKKSLNSFSRFKLRDRPVGWDLMNNDRLVVAPPSIHDTKKKKYTWVISPKTTPIAIMPKWLEDYLLNVKSFS